jgi:hypothetical protein
VHPAAATHIRSAAHIAIIAACFFIKVIPQKTNVHCNKEKLGLRYIRFLYVTSSRVTLRGYLPKKRALFVLFSISAKLDHRPSEAQ